MPGAVPFLQAERVGSAVEMVEEGGD